MSDTPISTVMSSNRRLAATIGKSTLFGVVASGTQIITRLATVPAIIHYLGLGGYGIWSIILVTAAYMRFGNAGVKSAFQKYVAEATATDDFQTANKLVSTGSMTMLVLSLVGLIPAAIWSQKLARLAGVPAQFVLPASASIVVLAGIYAISNFGSAFEAIVMGGHRIDLTRKFNSVLSVCEAVMIIVVLRAGYGLLAMTLIMGTSELIYIFCCYRVSHTVVPGMHISVANFTKGVFPELLRFAGSYQLVNVLEISYGAVVPVVLLKYFGAAAAGTVALAGRVTTAALIAQDALVLPILSGGALVFASGFTQTIRLFLTKSFKATLAVTVPPLAFVSVFGTSMIYAWTGETGPRFRTAICLVAVAALLRAVSLLQLILYRASGRALLDNIRQVLRIVVILIVASIVRRLGFTGLLVGLAAAELVGVFFMFAAMEITFHAFSVRILIQDALKIFAGTALVIGAGMAARMIPIQWSGAQRIGVTIKLGEIAFGCLLMAWPALVVTKLVSGAERRSLLDAIVPRRRKIVQANQ